MGEIPYLRGTFSKVNSGGNEQAAREKKSGPGLSSLGEEFHDLLFTSM
jgi:hypothetical protein